jgi:hypothetical protein
LSSTCSATKRDGSPCTLPTYGSSNLCWAHCPETAERRRRGQSRGGRNKPSRELADLKKQLADLYTATLEGRVDRGVAAVLAQIANARTRLLATELKIKEAEEFEERIARLETVAWQGGFGW